MDILNVIATMAVLMLHTSEYAFEYEPQQTVWYVSLAIQIIFIWAVPIFFMISGSNLLNYRERYDTKTFFKKRWSRVLIPFLFWSAIWYTWNHFIMHTGDWSLKGFINGVEYDTIQPIFWFFYFLIPIYIAIPYLSILATKSNKKIVQYIIILYFIGTCIFNYGYTLIKRAPDQLLNNIPLAISTGVGIFFVGWYLHNFEPTKNQRYLLYTTTILSIVLMFVVTIILSVRNNETVTDAYSIFSIGGFLMPLGIWVFIQRHFYHDWQPSERTAYWLKKLSGASLGVYVIHEFIIIIIEHLFSLSSASYIHIFLLPVVVWIISVTIVFILQKIPVVNRVLP